MEAPANDAEVARQLWRQWTDVVSQFATKQRGRLRIARAHYEAVYGRLMDTCERLRETSGPSGAEFWHFVQNLVAPWVSTAALEHSDPAVLADLMRRCHEVSRSLGQGRNVRQAVRRGVCCGLIAAALVAIGFGWSAWRNDPALLREVIDGGRIQLARLWLSMRGFGGSDFVAKFAVLALLVVVLGIRIVSSSARRT